MKKNLILGILAIATFWQLGLASEERPPFVQFARPMAMGGAFTAVADDNNTFSYNPAGLVQRKGSEFTLLEILGGVSQDAIDALEFLRDNEDHLTDFDDYSAADPEGAANLINEIRTDISRLNSRVFAAADVASYLSGPGPWGIHFGFGLLGSANNTFILEARQIAPTISYYFTSDAILPISLAKRWENPFFIPGKLGVGVTGKFLRRYEIISIRQSTAELDELTTPPLQKGKGFGGDIGLLYQPTDRINIGSMIQDAGGTKMSFEATEAEDGFPAQPERDIVIRPRTNLGLSIVPAKLLFLVPTNDRWTFSADIRDVFHPDEHVLFQNGFRKPFGENLYTHLHFGAEFRYWFLRFRGGINQGYPVGGLGIDIPFLKLDYAYFVREDGGFAGDVKEVNHALSLAIRFGSGNTEARERVKNAKETRKLKTGTPDEEMEPKEKGHQAVAEPESGGDVAPANTSEQKPESKE